MRSLLICQQCSARRTKYESFINISLPLVKYEKEESAVVGVEQCLDHFTKSEALIDLIHCPVCEQHTQSSQQHAFVTLPEVLCLHLKRFDSVTNKKLTDSVLFPTDGLNMGKYLAHWWVLMHLLQFTTIICFYTDNAFLI